MTGGNQLKLTQVVDGTAFGEAVRAAYLRGALVGGTSAGASAVSEHMIAFGDESDTPRQGVTASAAGLGLLPDVIVDQHFSQRNRYGRLLSLVARSPRLLGIGIDEDTAAVVRGGHLLEVVGTGCVFVADGSSAVSDAHMAELGAPLLVSGVVVHTLPAGARFDLDHPPSGRLPRGAPRPPDRQPPPGGRRQMTPQTSIEPGPRDPADACLPGAEPVVVRAGRPPRGRPRARWRTTPPTPSPASSTGCSRRCPAWRCTRAPAATAAASSSG